ncbi:hypothetical protein [Pacificibacter marinus]|uniref:hypothetical protein n=1 Tax=Pacificibacter marinus TaxID=658057 RepID=UPI001C078447|nr:hypothetical protein [Pacificibacter marinus]MBU2867151.1 hypothetical protein [Pacificibacter marinus]
MTQFDPRLAGAAPVSRVEAVDAQTLFLITALRTFGTAGEKDLWENYAALTDIERADTARSAFDTLMGFVTRNARRPLMTHGGACNCIGADEASFAQFVRLAAEGDAEDAMLMGMLLLRADVVPMAVGLAQQLGLLIGGNVGQAIFNRPKRAAYH